MAEAQAQITLLLQDLCGGNRKVVDQLASLLYDELHHIAKVRLAHERPDHTLNATALVNEAYIKLVNQDRVSWHNRAHFLGVAAVAMRRILVNYAKGRVAEKRGGGRQIVTFVEDMYEKEVMPEELIALDRALEELGSVDARGARIVELRFFGGLTMEEVADVLGISLATAKRDWRMARAWLGNKLSEV